MNKEIICVYQDCPLCGDKGKKLKKIIFDKNLNVKKISFASNEGKELCHEAVFKHKICKMPFYTDGKIFSNNINDLLEQPIKKAKKTVKKSAKRVKTNKKKEVEDGANS